jgi:4'-phosphopantetheinyl transferase
MILISQSISLSLSIYLGSWNYNVSHHGRYVCIASHPSLLVGVDLVDLKTRASYIQSSKEYFDMFVGVMHPRELNVIYHHSGENDQYNAFFINWSLKEAFVKAIGKGLGFNLQGIYIYISNYLSIYVSISTI